jgi:two-component system response regulator YesN
VFKVILLDDEDTIIEGLQTTVAWEKYRCKVVATATNGKDGLELIRKHRPDILFTDIRMPYLNGLEMLKELTGEFPRMQIIVLSGYRDFSYAQTALHLGVLRFLLKPSKMEEIYEALNAAMLKLSGVPQEVNTRAALNDKKEEDNEGNFIVSRTMKYINEHYAEKLTLQQVADYLFISTWHLCRVLKKHSDTNFVDILNHVRIEHAKKFLRETNLKVYEISERVGYSDIAYFSKVFRALTGLSPKQFREGSAKEEA